MNTLVKCSTGLLAIALSGCMSTPEVIEPVPFDTNNSYALNIANQTSLMKNNSPLRDFTDTEINGTVFKVDNGSGGDLSLLFGTVNILSGNFTGAIDVVGGAAANIAESEHTAGQMRLFVVANLTQLSNSKNTSSIQQKWQ